MVSTVIYDGGPLPITISSEEADLVSNDWTAYLFRDNESFVAMPKSDFTLSDGFFEYIIPAETMANLAKGMYSLRVDVAGTPFVVANILSLKKHTRLIDEQL